MSGPKVYEPSDIDITKVEVTNLIKNKKMGYTAYLRYNVENNIGKNIELTKIEFIFEFGKKINTSHRGSTPKLSQRYITSGPK